jgi:putative aminopeptidase FrvX
MSSSNTHAGTDGWKAAWESGENIEYSTIGIPTEQRDQLRELRDEMEFETYALLVDELIENAQEDLSNE